MASYAVTLGLCKEQWPESSVFSAQRRRVSYKRTYLRLDEGTLTFNSDPEKVWQQIRRFTGIRSRIAPFLFQGMSYFFDHGLLRDSPDEIARFFLTTRTLSRVRLVHHVPITSSYVLVYLYPFLKSHIRNYVQNRQDIVNCMVAMQDFQGKEGKEKG